ncbi:hypothetical protein KL941_001224 [Ogataea angusta]|nr:hypothetical protein KL941_001224 [Ogataea angusta]
MQTRSIMNKQQKEEQRFVEHMEAQRRKRRWSTYITSEPSFAQGAVAGDQQEHRLSESPATLPGRPQAVQKGGYGYSGSTVHGHSFENSRDVREAADGRQTARGVPAPERLSFCQACQRRGAWGLEGQGDPARPGGGHATGYARSAGPDKARDAGSVGPDGLCRAADRRQIPSATCARRAGYHGGVAAGLVVCEKKVYRAAPATGKEVFEPMERRVAVLHGRPRARARSVRDAGDVYRAGRRGCESVAVEHFLHEDLGAGADQDEHGAAEPGVRVLLQKRAARVPERAGRGHRHAGKADVCGARENGGPEGA